MTVTSKRPFRPAWIGAVAVVVLIVLGVWFSRAGSADNSDGGNGGSGSRTGRLASATSATSTISTTSTGAPTGSASVDPETGLLWVDLAALPTQGRRTVALIEAGGPYPYSRDGIVFGNREGLLPRERSGWYHEYTVPTPGSNDRGARRIVTGGPSGATVDHGLELFYSDDHYDSFRRIRVGS